MADDALSLASFPEATYDGWRALVAGDGRSPADLARADADGLRIEPLYADEHVAGLDPGWPGAAPFVRGASALGTAVGGWEVRQAHRLHRVDGAGVAEAAQAVRADVEGGATGLALALDRGAEAALEPVLAGVDLASVAVHLELSDDGATAVAALEALWRARGVAPGAARGGFGLDPLGRAGGDPSAARLSRLDDDLASAARAAAALGARWPGAAGLVVDVRPHHDAGATPAMCAGIALSTGVAYLRALASEGLDVAAGAARLRFHWSLDADVLGGAILLRAARRTWARVLDACGAAPAAGAMRCDVTTARRMLAAEDPETNIVRATLAVVGAVLGGADAIVVRPHDEALGAAPSAHARRIARNVQRVLLDEGQLNRVVDAAGGSYAVEARTDALAHAAWGRFQAIERAGGMPAALRSGLVGGWLAEAAAARAARLADGREVVVGVNRYRSDGAAGGGAGDGGGR